MILNAAIIAATCTIVFYAGLAIARRTRSKLYQGLIRIGAVVLTLACIGILPMLMNVSVATSGLAGRYMLFTLIGGALVYKLVLVRFIPIPAENSEP
ncbi:hypothetical protein [Microbulbifer celer]|uniref:Uncharacterized protein n=1 Tax=Microbulbifer celer TaxID=435905 RepID=A0ABW3UAE8_9GAMM|nr:hypothetical protein [Microbulbifer celer]UFN57062.1 hypothetical protein LPW13_16075 [Microbulbifer celer]